MKVLLRILRFLEAINKMPKEPLWELDGFHVEHFDVIDSTNSECKRRLKKLVDFNTLHKTVLVADMQTNGRGRLNRKFYSPANTGLYFSMIYTSGNFDVPAKITASAAVAVCRAVKEVFAQECSIKWVNDIFYNNKKICGILTEGMISPNKEKIGAVVIGIGINLLWNNEIPKDLQNSAGAILQNKKNSIQDFNFQEKKIFLFKKILLNLADILDGSEQNLKSAFVEYKKRSNLIGKRVEVSPVIGQNKTNYFCTVLDISSSAGLIVRTDDGLQKELDSGEVTLHSSFLVQ